MEKIADKKRDLPPILLICTAECIHTVAMLKSWSRCFLENFNAVLRCIFHLIVFIWLRYNAARPFFASSNPFSFHQISAVMVSLLGNIRYPKLLCIVRNYNSFLSANNLKFIYVWSEMQQELGKVFSSSYGKFLQLVDKNIIASLTTIILESNIPK